MRMDGVVCPLIKHLFKLENIVKQKNKEYNYDYRSSKRRRKY